MLIRPKQLSHFIQHYYGYGSWQAGVWFIGYEEGGGDLPEEVAAKVDYFYDNFSSSKAPTLCNIRDVYRHVQFRAEGPKAEIYSNRFEYRFGEKAVKHGVWKNLTLFLHGFRGKDSPDLLKYQQENFASAEKAEEALIQLYPLPSPHNHAWYYSWLELPELPFLKSRSLYEEHVYDQRIRSILTNIAAYRPEVVMMYGMTNINALKRSVAESFPGVEFKQVNAMKQHIPQHHRARLASTTLIITTQIPALRHNRIETGFDWEAFGKSIRG